MRIRRVKLEGSLVEGAVVDAALLRDLLGLVIEGSRRAVRIRAQGRSTARGPLPRWVVAASQFSVRILEGSTVLEVRAPTLMEAQPEEFGQRDLFPQVDPELTAFDYFADALSAALREDERPEAYDRQLLTFLTEFESVFERGVDSLRIEAKPEGRRREVSLARQDLATLSRLEKSIPPSQSARLAGRLNWIRHSDGAFSVRISTTQEVRGITDAEHRDVLQSLWGKDVVVSGVAHFTASGTVQRLDAVAIKPATERDLELWSTPPVPLYHDLPATEYRVRQGARTGINALIGRWPGEESDEEILAVLDDLS